MASETLIKTIEEQDLLEQASDVIQPAVGNAFEATGEPGRRVKNALHGTWLGHPLHPALVAVPLGAWTTALAFDAMDAVSGRDGFAAGADAAIGVGLVGAVGSAVTGLADWSAVDGRARRVGLAHGLLNAGATALYAASLVMRRTGRRRAGVGLSMLGYAVSNAAAYLGGHLVFGERIGVDHSRDREWPTEFVSVIAEDDLPEGELVRADARGVAVLLVRRGERVFALAETCSHLGGPLSEGKLDGDVVQCPWHGSRFSLADGSVVDGPATFAQPCLETRTREGQVEVRASSRCGTR